MASGLTRRSRPPPWSRALASFRSSPSRARARRLVLVIFPDQAAREPAARCPRVTELFLIDGKNLLQLTNFGRADTGVGGGLHRPRPGVLHGVGQPPR